MRDITKVVIAALLLSFLLATWQAFAFMPATMVGHTPQTVWSDQGAKGTVSGKVVTSLDQSKGLDGAYIALVDPMSPGVEYANTTSDSNGNFHFKDMSATFSSELSQGPDGTGGTYTQGMNAYMIYANKTGIGEGYSSTFGIDTNHTTTPMVTVVIDAGVPESDASPEPTATEQPTVQPTVVVPTPVHDTVPATPPTATPGPDSQFPIGLLPIAAILVVLVIAGVVAYALFLRKK